MAHDSSASISVMSRMLGLHFPFYSTLTSLPLMPQPNSRNPRKQRERPLSRKLTKFP
ncbi:hypothetical protein ID866_11284 [Astraeus odoratus]|nr:hypothetical protein ID866_11284 [Astraeus odoratus]